VDAIITPAIQGKNSSFRTLLVKKLDELATFSCYYGSSPGKGLVGGYVSTALTFVIT
jgi:hypothetical protein